MIWTKQKLYELRLLWGKAKKPEETWGHAPPDVNKCEGVKPVSMQVVADYLHTNVYDLARWVRANEQKWEKLLFEKEEELCRDREDDEDS